MADNDKKDIGGAVNPKHQALVDKLNATLKELEGMGVIQERGGLGPGKFILVDGKLVMTGP